MTRKDVSSFETLRKNDGFTIVELLIVIVVIGILAAIVIVAYNGIQNSAHNTAVQQDLRQAKMKIEAYRIDPNGGNGSYPTSGTPLINADITVSKSAYLDALNMRYCWLADGSGYSLSARSKGGGMYTISHLNGVTELTNYPTGSGTGSLCDITISATTGTWGNNPGAGGWSGWVKG
jgi:prepilin-type N-terminal cleavage/methylation domain-containing protein